MALDEYKNLTEGELVMADHYAEIGDMHALRRYQKISEERGNENLNEETYFQPMKPRSK